jgi:hypothetical protein
MDSKPLRDESGNKEDLHEDFNIRIQGTQVEIAWIL